MADQDFKELGRRRVYRSVTATVAASGGTDVLVVNTRGIEQIMVHLTVASASLTGFAIKGKASPSATAATLYNTTAGFTAPAGLLLGASGDLTLAAAGAHWFIMDTRCLEEVTLTATSGGTATVAVEMGGFGV